PCPTRRPPDLSPLAGHSYEQPLQDRHRSSDSASSSERKSFTRLPLASSCKTRARPRVESFSSLVARQDGHITPPTSPAPFTAVVSARHLPTPTQRCTAADRSPPSWE